MHFPSGPERDRKKQDEAALKTFFFQKVLNKKDPPQGARARAGSKELRSHDSGFESISQYFAPPSLSQPHCKDLLNASLDGLGRWSAERGSRSFEDAQTGLLAPQSRQPAPSSEEKELRSQVQALRAKVQEQSLVIESLRRQTAIGQKERDLMQAHAVGLQRRLNSLRDCEQENQRLRHCYQEILSKYLQAKSELVEKVARLASFTSPKRLPRSSPDRARLQTEPACSNRLLREEVCLTFGSEQASSLGEASLQEESTSIAGQGSTERDRLLALQQKVAQLKKTNLDLVEELKAAYLCQHRAADAFALKQRRASKAAPENRPKPEPAAARRHKSLSSSLARQLTSILKKDSSNRAAADGPQSDIESGFLEVKLRSERDDEETPRFEQVSALLGSEKYRSRTEQPAKRAAAQKDTSSRRFNVELLSSDLPSNDWGGPQLGLARVDVCLARARLVRQQVPSQLDSSSGYRREWLNV